MPFEMSLNLYLTCQSGASPVTQHKILLYKALDASRLPDNFFSNPRLKNVAQATYRASVPVYNLFAYIIYCFDGVFVNMPTTITDFKEEPE
jgi:hypothetical protein